MNKLANKKFILLGAFSVILSLWLLVPTTQGLYAPSVGTASTIGPGTYQDTIAAGDANGYYNVSGVIDATLTVSVTYSTATAILELYLHCPNYAIADSDLTMDGDQTVSTVMNDSAPFIIRFFKYPGALNITLTISITSPGIPGFTLVLTTFSILSLFAILILYRRQKFPI
jgi:hypothetical protein